MKKVQAIQAKALSLGWKSEQLWETEGGFHKEGIVCLIGEHREIGEITREYIELCWDNKQGLLIKQKFYNHEVDQL